ncbi:hypothetical protein MRB53_041922 [Persea americana]|nr:hypothetical protein MRB53_041922 [Persea americana]
MQGIMRRLHNFPPLPDLIRLLDPKHSVHSQARKGSNLNGLVIQGLSAKIAKISGADKRLETPPRRESAGEMQAPPSAGDSATLRRAREAGDGDGVHDVLMLSLIASGDKLIRRLTGDWRWRRVIV